MTTTTTTGTTKKPKRNPNQVLTSLFKNVPHKLRAEMMKYQTTGKRIYKMRANGRTPKPGKHFGSGGRIRLEDCLTTDIYVDETEYHYNIRQHKEYFKWRDDYDKQHKKLIEEYDNQVLEQMQVIDDLEIKFNDLFGNRQELEQKVAILSSNLNTYKETNAKLTANNQYLKEWVTDLIKGSNDESF